MAEVQAARREISRVLHDALPAIEKGSQNGGNKLLGELAVYAMQLEAGVKGILALGVTIKDIDAGLVDFIGVRNGREVYLCWRYDEEELSFWHEINAGFAGRRPLDEYIR